MPEVAEIPVSVVVLSDLPTGVPTPLVAEIPVNGTPIFKVTDPNEEVAEIPVSVVVLSDLPTGVPTEEVNEIPVNSAIVTGVAVTEPTVEVNERPVRETVNADSPQFSDPHVSLPHPCSGKARTVPSVDVVESPVNVRVTSAC